MNIPTFVRQQFVDKEGYLTDPMNLYFDQWNVQAQLFLSQDGLVSPSRTTADINSIASNTNENARPNGTLWYDSDTSEFKGKIGGVVKVFQLV